MACVVSRTGCAAENRERRSATLAAYLPSIINETFFQNNEKGLKSCGRLCGLVHHFKSIFSPGGKLFFPRTKIDLLGKGPGDGGGAEALLRLHVQTPSLP